MWLPQNSAYSTVRYCKAKAMAYNICIYRNKPQFQLQRLFCVTDRAGIQPMGRKLSTRPRTLTCNQTVIRSPGLHFNGLHPRNPCNYMDYYSFTDPGWMKADYIPKKLLKCDIIWEAKSTKEQKNDLHWPNWSYIHECSRFYYDNRHLTGIYLQMCVSLTVSFQCNHSAFL